MANEMPLPKYKIGDVVWSAGYDRTRRALQCPDCLGTRKWSVTTPAGRDVEMACPRCCKYGSHRSLEVWEHTPTTRALTIGQIRIEWPKPHHSATEHPVQYMAEETGIGSGSLYREDTLFPTKEDAQAHSLVMIEAADLRASDESKKRAAETLEWGTYDVIDMQIAEAKAATRAASNKHDDLCNSIGELFESWNADMTVRQLRDAIRELIPEECIPESARQP